MAIIKAKPKINKAQVRISLGKTILDEIKAYNDWAHVDKVDDFVEQAARFVFEKDKDWQKHKANLPQSE